MEERKEQQQQTSSTSTSAPQSPKQPSPLLDLIPGSRQRSRMNAERENERRKSRGESNAIFGDNFHLYFKQEDIKKCPFSVAQAVSAESPIKNLIDFNAINPPDVQSINPNFQVGSLVSIFDPQSNRFVYNLVTKSKDAHKASYSCLEQCLQSFKKQIDDFNITSLALPQLECFENGLHWPKVCQIILKIFKNSNLNLYSYV